MMVNNNYTPLGMASEKMDVYESVRFSRQESASGYVTTHSPNMKYPFWGNSLSSQTGGAGAFLGAKMVSAFLAKRA